MSDWFSDFLAVDAMRVIDNIEREKLEQLEGAKVIVTGATGLIGLNIVSALIYYNSKYAKKDIKLSVVTYRKPPTYLLPTFNRPCVSLITGNITSSSTIKELPVADYIIHCAGYGQPGKFLERQLETISIKTTATISLLSKLKRGGNFLFLSSAEIYSGDEKLAHNESDIGTTDPNHSRACYIEGNRAGETIVNVARQSGFNAVSARLALAYGPGVRIGDSRAINQLINKSYTGVIELLDSGSASRTYGYISDVTEMLLNILIENPHPVYNVGGKSSVTIKDLALIIGRLNNATLKIPSIDSFMKDAPRHVGLDLSRVEKTRLVNTYVELEHGIDRTTTWISKLR
jgi:nucleoside-diphosphate-sugar epimerase